MKRQVQRLMSEKPKNVADLNWATVKAIRGVTESSDASNDNLMQQARAIMQARQWLAAGGRYRRL